MAFEGLSGRLSEVFKKLKGRGKVKESDIKEVMREVRMALLSKLTWFLFQVHLSYWPFFFF